MLFDERELREIENENIRMCFKEILQLYYNKNYRAAVVMLHSLVVYDLFVKLKEIASDKNTDMNDWDESIKYIIKEEQNTNNVNKKQNEKQDEKEDKKREENIRKNKYSAAEKK